MLEQRFIEIENSDLSEELKTSTIEALIKFKPDNNDLVCNGYPDYYASKAENYYKILGDIDEKYLEILFKWFPSNVSGRRLIFILDKCKFDYDNKIFIHILKRLIEMLNGFYVICWKEIKDGKE